MILIINKPYQLNKNQEVQWMHNIFQYKNNFKSLKVFNIEKSFTLVTQT